MPYCVSTKALPYKFAEAFFCRGMTLAPAVPYGSTFYLSFGHLTDDTIFPLYIVNNHYLYYNNDIYASEGVTFWKTI